LNIRAALCLALLLALSGCAKFRSWSPEYHTVRNGETVFSIAQRYDVAVNDIQRWNDLDNNTLIYAGQNLRLRSPAPGVQSVQSVESVQSAKIFIEPPPVWQWPVQGTVAGSFGSSAGTRSGVRISAATGGQVLAAASGEIVYADDGLPHYGLLLIIKHSDSWLTAYGFNTRLLVREGDKVTIGQPVAMIGGDSRGPALLHFEMRRVGQPVDPVRYLPKR
jgi:lipoprotein NlpD